MLLRTTASRAYGLLQTRPTNSQKRQYNGRRRFYTTSSTDATAAASTVTQPSRLWYWLCGGALALTAALQVSSYLDESKTVQAEEQDTQPNKHVRALHVLYE